MDNRRDGKVRKGSGKSARVWDDGAHTWVLDDGRERRQGFLHPKCYLWVIYKVFEGDNRKIPSRLSGAYFSACTAWAVKPHRGGLLKWELRRFERVIAYIIGIEPEELRHALLEKHGCPDEGVSG